MKAHVFHKQMATGIFKPIYPVIARNILQKSQICKGHCVDVGGGSGVLAMELIRQTRVPFWTMESSDEGTWILFRK